MQDPDTIMRAKDLASSAMDSTQQKITELDHLSSTARHSAESYLLNWQTWMGNVSFTLAAIGGAVLIGNDKPHLSVTLSLLIFLVTGLWILIYQKRQLERASSLASKDVEEYRPLYEDKKKAAYKMYGDPSNIEKRISYLEHELKITKLSKKLEETMISDLEKATTSFLNDIWLALIVTAVYLMVWPAAKLTYTSLHIVDQFPLISLLVWFVFMLVIVREAERGNRDVKIGTKSKIVKFESALKHSTEYIQEIEKSIASLKP